MRKLYFYFLTVLACLIGATNRGEAQCVENFDAVVAPALPAGWSAITNVSGGGSTAWVTTNTSNFSAPNSAFTNNATDISDEWFNSTPFAINSTSATVTFRNNYNLENGFDGMVLEISIGAGPFIDILAAGGTFVSGGYNGIISVNWGSPIAGRQAWTGSSSGFILTTVNLPASANGQTVVLRWRRATDNSVGGIGAFVDNVVVCGTSTCANTPVTITTNPSNRNICAGANTSFTVAATGSALTYQWQVNPGSGFTNIANGGPYSGATTTTLNITGAPFAFNGYQYRAVVTGLCNSANSSPATLTLTQGTHSNVVVNPVTSCSPGATTITATAASSNPGAFTHSLTGPGTIVQNPPTGANNQNASFSISAIPAGVHNYVLTSTDAAGCTAISNISVTVNPTPVVTIAPVAAICNGAVQQLTATVTPPLPQLVTGGGTVTIPLTAGTATPYSSNLVITGLPTTGVTIKSVSLNGFSHTWPSDLDIVLQSPTGANVILMSDVGGSTDIVNQNITFDDAAASGLPGVIVGGTYKPTNTSGPDNFPAPGPGSITQVNPTLAGFGAADYNGVWKLFVVDQANGDGGAITNWTITFNIPVPVTWTAGAGGAGTIFTNPAGTTPYVAGTPTILPVYVKPSATTTATVTSYTATATSAGCTGSATINVTTNALPAITTQPEPATQTICPGFNVVYSVAATGTGLTYQWRKNGVSLINGVQASGSSVSGATTNSVTLIGVVAADAGTYTVQVSGTCLPAVISSNAVLVIAAAPTISTQPTSRTVCEGLPTTFTVAATGSITPTIFQWQVSTNGGGTWTNLITGGSFTSSFTIPAVTLAMSGNLYRVIVTNSCGQSTTSNSATLTVTAFTPVTATALPATICLSDAPIALVGSPVGGTWSGIGVSGSNFVPSATAAGTYILTYTFTNGASCVSTTTITARVVDAQACGRINLLRDNAVILYPNPNDGRFNIRINSTLYGFLGMQVYTPAGQLVHKQSFTNLVFGQVISIDLSKLPSGPYMVRFFYDGGARTSEKTFPVVIGRD